MKWKLSCFAPLSTINQNPECVTTEYERAQNSEKMLTISTSTWHVIWRKKVTGNGKKGL